MTQLVSLGIEYFPDPTKGKPVFFGSIYVGDPDTDPEIESNQKSVTLKEEDGTLVSVSQPVATGAGGVPLYNGSPVQILTDGNYSLKVLNKSGKQVYYVPNFFEGTPLTEFDGRYIVPFDTVADMVASTTLVLDTDVFVRDYGTGYGSGPLRFKVVAAATGTDDGGEYIDLPNTTPALQAQQLFPGGKRTFKMWGARANGSNSDYNAMLACYAANAGQRVTATEGTYIFETNLSMSSETEFEEGAIFKPVIATLTVDNNIVASATQIFDNGAGGLFTPGDTQIDVYPQWWGAAGDNTRIDTEEVQEAIDFCIAGDLNMRVSGIYLLDASVNIDRQVDGAAFDNYFIISSTNGGGFGVKTAIAMFSSTITYTTDPVSQLVKWDNIVFTSNNASLAAYVLDGARFLRSRFDGCSFQKIKCLVDASVYTQSLSFTDCNMRRWQGIFFSCDQFNYDLKVLNCLMEAGADAWKLKNPIGVTFQGTDIEGMAGTAISYDGAQGLDVSGCYFEQNGLDLDGTYGGTSSSNSQGVALTGNYFASTPATYTVKWGATLECVSLGNWHTNNMHNLTSATNGLVIYDTAQSNLSTGQIPNILKSGYDGTFTGTLTGCTTSPTVTLRYNKTGNTVTLYIPNLTGTSNTTQCTITGLPSHLYPARQQTNMSRVMDNTVTQLGVTLVDTGGDIVLNVGANADPFTASGTKGSQVNTITYSLT